MVLLMLLTLLSWMAGSLQLRRNTATAWYPYVRHLSPDRPNYERLVNDIMLKNPTIGGLPAVVVPFFPDDAVWVTLLNNVSL